MVFFEVTAHGEDDRQRECLSPAGVFLVAFQSLFRCCAGASSRRPNTGDL